jgi:hypothetical protein
MSLLPFLDNVRSRIGQWITPTEGVVASTPPSVEDESAEHLLRLEMVQEYAEASDASNGKHLAPERYENPLWRLGWTDGRLGQTPVSQSEVFDALVTMSVDQRKERLQRELAIAKVDLALKQEREERKAATYDSLSTDFDKMAEERRKKRGAYSRSMAILYCLFGMAIFIADIPLSFRAAGTLGISTAIEGTNISTSNLLALIFRGYRLWDAIAVAVGIAAMTIFFKMVVDQLHIPERFETKWSRRIGLGLMLLVFAGVIATFGLIGYARTVSLGVTVPTWVKMSMFISLTLMFPMVAGYCFSSARLSWQNSALYTETRKQLDMTRPALERARTEAKSALAEVDQLSHELETVAERPQHAHFLRTIYEHGYSRGRCVPHTGLFEEGLYRQCEELVRRWLGMLVQNENEAMER